MKKLGVFIFVVAFVFFACNKGEKEKNGQKEKNYPVLEISEVSQKGGNFLDSIILITGYVDHVCHEDGKKLLLVDTVSGKNIKVITENPFDTALTGTVVTILGVLRGNPFTMDDFNKMKTHMLEKHPDGLDSSDQARLDQIYDRLINSPDSSITLYYVEFKEFK